MVPDSPKIINRRYVLHEIIQAGGMTNVYKARDIFNDSVVAIKRFDRDIHLPNIEREAYDREVEALKELTHPNIVRILDSGEDEEGKLFLVLELMDHDLLQEKDRGGPAFDGWDDFTEKVILPLLSALSYAHERGIAHRDVKPANVLIGLDGSIKLADFGISKLKRTLHPRITLNNFMSPPFCPPECDNGAFSYARDVYSIGMLFLWGISEVTPKDYNDISPALEKFDAHPDIVKIVTQALSEAPETRQQSAAELANDIERVHATRQYIWAEQNRPRCYLKITRRALDAISVELDQSSVENVEQYIAQDINTDSFVQRFVEKPGTVDQKIIPQHYAFLGSNFRYHVAEDTRGGNGLVLLNVFHPENNFLLRDRQNSAPSPVTLELKLTSEAVEKFEAIRMIEGVLEEFEAKRKEEERQNKETSLFDTWIRVLDAKMQFEQEQFKPIHFDWSTQDKPFVTLQTKESTAGISIGEIRNIECEGGKRIRGEVWDVRPGEVVLNCPGSLLSDLPTNGVARIDLWAMKVAVDRQREAVDRIRSGNVTSGKFKALVLDPSLATAPNIDVAIDQDIENMLDKSKREAVKRAIGTKDILIVEGPPGTGKTHFIAALILQELKDNPKAHIVIASQTHIAIDNALERISKYDSNVKILRIAQVQTNISPSSSQYLMEERLKVWRKEITEKARKGLEHWAGTRHLNLGDIKIGTLIQQIAILNESIDSLRQKIKQGEEYKGDLEKSKDVISSIEYNIESDRIGAELSDVRTQLEINKKSLEHLQLDISEISPGAKELVNLTVSEQLEWADAFIGTSPEGRMAKSLIKIQSEWFERFGTKRGFVKPLIDRTSVVAATCVGLASVEELSESVFDLCIIDEASKATAMECAVPMIHAKKWVLVGDSKQLPPFREEILSRPELRERFDIGSIEATETLFGRFQRLAPAVNKVKLTEQYRMVAPIRKLISECFYDSELSGGGPIDKAICFNTGKAVNWFSTSQIINRGEQTAGTSFINPEEAVQVCNLLQKLDALFIKKKIKDKNQVLVLSAYEAQSRYLQKRVDQVIRQINALKIECCTVDQVQGREADIVLFSVTRSNKDNKAGFLGSLERINVALSRARELLYIVGDDKFISRAENADSLQRVLDYMRITPEDSVIVSIKENGVKQWT